MPRRSHRNVTKKERVPMGGAGTHVCDHTVASGDQRSITLRRGNLIEWFVPTRVDGGVPLEGGKAAREKWRSNAECRLPFRLSVINNVPPEVIKAALNLGLNDF